MDYCKLNVVTIRDSDPIPRMDKCINWLWRGNYILSMDANGGYWQAEMAEEDRDKTAFSFYHCIFHFACMHFDLKKALRTIHRSMEVLLTKVEGQFVHVYLNNIFIFSLMQKKQKTHV